MKNLVWRASALDDLDTIIDYIAERNSVAAERLLGAIEASSALLAKHPQAFRVGRVAGTREAVVHPNYILIYRETDEAVEIVSLVHARQQYP